MWSTPIRRSVGRDATRSSAAAASANRSRSRRRRGVHADLAAGLGVDEGQLADVGQRRPRVDRRSRRPGRGGGRPTRRAAGASSAAPGSRRRGRPGRLVAQRRWRVEGHQPARSPRRPPRPSRPGSRGAGRAARPGPRPAAGADRASHRTSRSRVGSRAGLRDGRSRRRHRPRRRPCVGRRSRTSSMARRRAASHAVRARSGTWTRTCGTAVRAVTFQSIRRMSSPGSYGRTWASSVPPPRSWARYSPGSRPRIRRPIVRSRARRSASGVGPGPGRAGVRWAPAMALFQPVMRSAPRAARRHRMARPTD